MNYTLKELEYILDIKIQNWRLAYHNTLNDSDSLNKKERGKNYHKFWLKDIGVHAASYDIDVFLKKYK